MLQCFKTPFFLMTSRGWLLWFQKDLGFIENSPHLPFSVKTGSFPDFVGFFFFFLLYIVIWYKSKFILQIMVPLEWEQTINYFRICWLTGISPVQPLLEFTQIGQKRIYAVGSRGQWKMTRLLWAVRMLRATPKNNLFPWSSFWPGCVLHCTY